MMPSDRVPLAFQIEIETIQPSDIEAVCARYREPEDDDWNEFDTCVVCGEVGHEEDRHEFDPICEFCGWNEWHGCQCPEPSPRSVIVLPDPTKKF